MPESGTLFFPEDYAPDTFKLIELPPKVEELMEECRDSGITINFSIRGGLEEEAVFCTPNETYQLKEVLTSNSLYVVTPERDRSITLSHGTIPEGSVPYQIVDKLNSIVELIQVPPKLNKIPLLIGNSLYRGPSEDAEVTAKQTLHRWEDLQALVQASDEELRYGLKEVNAVCIDGYWRMIDPGYLSIVLELILNLISAEEINPEALEPERFLTELADAEIPEFIVTHCLSSFSHPNSDDTLRLDKDKVCRFVGEHLLEERNDHKWPEKVFIDTWQKKVDIFPVNLTLLEGLYFTEVSINKERYITYVPISSLPTDPAGRFRQLFLLKPRGAAHEILPYISDLAIGKKRDALLL
ncbi:Ctf8p and Ctf18p associating protein [Basidiobolus ranarum]|uniref:Ctf8p and Ctf18p associating protein n=1 Tax=Basidiobolus ranarum TaxID=34480 RepID=A0ABR2WGW3_9FUNG